MIAGLALCAAAWLVAGALGAPVDPFLPLAAALSLHPGLSPWARVAGAAALGTLTASACGDPVAERTALYVAIGVVATRAGWTLRDGVAARTLLVAGTLGVVLGVRAVLAAVGATPAPGQALVAVAASVAWTAAHAALTRPRRTS
jgi:hypothetical protein